MRDRPFGWERRLTSEGSIDPRGRDVRDGIVRRLSSSGNRDRSGSRAIVVIATLRGSGQVERIFTLAGCVRPEEHLRRLAPAGVWAGDR